MKTAAKAMLVVQDTEDIILVGSRRAVCLSCGKREPKQNVCTECDCYLDVKWSSLVNRDIRTGKNEVTKCPLGKW